MNRTDVLSLDKALNIDGLKSKHLSGPNFVLLIGLKREMTKYLAEMAEEEKELLNAYDGELIDGGFKIDDKVKKEFYDKLAVIQNKDFEPTKLNFIPQEEFKKWIDDVDIKYSFILSEHILQL